MLLAAALALVQLADAQGNFALPHGQWRAWLDVPGGELPFKMETRGTAGALEFTIFNGSEAIPVTNVSATIADGVRLGFPHYDSEIRALTSFEGARLDGTWRKRRGPNTWTEIPFHAMFGEQTRFPAAENAAAPDPAAWTGRWAVRFEAAADPAVGVFFVREDGFAQGTFLTTLGDYRFLAGSATATTLRLSTFDGAHAFLFGATLAADGSMSGDFWSGATHHETWTAQRDPSAALPDAFAEVTPSAETPSLSALKYLDLEGVERALDDPAFAGKARVISLMGSWCPNCNDEAQLWAELHARYAERGLSILSLGFELSGDSERDTEQLRRFRDRHGARWPILLAGTADKEAAARAFPLLTRIKSFPTAVFLDASGRVRAIHSGFAGPATGIEHERQRLAYERIIEELLAESSKEE
ncbi:MAG: TlpA disulfide reductase family protein [Planctomycetota bacterium]|nr:TlpA disulfide reductase family protein [Planctomycetota bacterium]